MITEQTQQEQQQYSIDDGYQVVRTMMRDRIEESVTAKTQLFTTNAEGLFDVFLSNLPESHRQHYRCNCCRQFINRFGGLVTIDADGGTLPVMWPIAYIPELFRQAFTALSVAVYRAKVTGVFMSEGVDLGTAATGAWTHFHATLPQNWCGRVASKIKTPHQLMAEKAEDFKTVCQFLGDFGIDVIKEAHRIIDTGTLLGCEKAAGPAKWLSDLQELRKSARGTARDNLTWLAIANAPAGFCHPRASILGEIIDQVKSGASFDSIRRRMGAMTDPLKYQRAQTLPTAGSLKRAEEIFEKMNLAPALHRRFARIEEIQTMWRPAAPTESPKPSGIFGHIPAKGAAPVQSTVDVPSITMTWEKFKRVVLPKADRIQYEVRRPAEFMALITSVDPMAEPILKWDFSDNRNPVNWYTYNHPSDPSAWHLSYGWCEVTGITALPCHWRDDGSNPQFANRVIFLLDGAWDSRDGGLALFPNVLKSELHEVRSVIENFSNRGKINGRSKEESTACGVALGDGNTVDIRVWHDGVWNLYRLDRMD